MDRTKYGYLSEEKITPTSRKLCARLALYFLSDENGNHREKEKTTIKKRHSSDFKTSTFNIQGSRDAEWRNTLKSEALGEGMDKRGQKQFTKKAMTGAFQICTAKQNIHDTNQVMTHMTRFLR